MQLYTSKKALISMLYCILFILVIVFFNRYYYDGTEQFKSTLDGRNYRVRIDSNSQLKADLLAFINFKLNILVDELANDPTQNSNIPVQRLINNWRRGVTIKEIGYMESDAAYVINKQNMSFCLQDGPEPGNKPKTKSFADTNLITYVCIHELAHIMSVETGHGSEFIQNFQYLLSYAKNIDYVNPFTGNTEKLYTSLNKVKETSDNYCGVKLENSIN